MQFVQNSEKHEKLLKSIDKYKLEEYTNTVLKLNIAGWSSWQLVGLITRRSIVRVYPPQPQIPSLSGFGYFLCRAKKRRKSDGLFLPQYPTPISVLRWGACLPSKISIKTKKGTLFDLNKNLFCDIIKTNTNLSLISIVF